jgi:two-component system, OmpR family, sensor kinase
MSFTEQRAGSARIGPRSLAARMTAATVVAGSISALVASFASLAAADRLMRDADDRRLRATASDVLRELPITENAQTFSHAVHEEELELEPAGLRIRVLRAGTLVGGDATLPEIVTGACASKSAQGVEIRTCAASAGDVLVTVGCIRSSYGRFTVPIALLVSVIIAALCAWLLGRRAGRWALEPLARLYGSLGTIAAHSPEKALLLSPDEPCDEVAALSRALSDLMQRLGEALGAARNFSAEAAHELKTPLTTLRAELDLLAEEALAPEARSAVERLRTRIALMSELVDRLLLLATLTDRSTLPQDAVALEDVARAVVAKRAPDERARIKVDAATQGIVRGDESLLHALIDNGIDNALKFSSGEVTVTVAEHAGRVALEILDRGPGVPEALRARAFEPFYRSADARGANVRGNGLGLALVAQIAAAHRATASFEQPKVSGACLRFTFPRWRSDEGETHSLRLKNL